MSSQGPDIAALQRELSEAQELVRAIRAGEVDAFVLGEPDSYRVHALEGADTPYRVLVEAMRQGAATVGSDGTVLYANRRLCEMLELERHDIVGHPIDEVLGPGSLDMEPLLTETLGTETRQETSFHRGEVLVPALVSVFALPHHLPTPTFCLVITDVSERRAMEEREAHLARERASLAAIFSHLPFAVFVADAEGQLQYANENGDRLLASTDGMRERIRQGASAALGNSPAPPREIALARSDGSTAHYALHWNAVRMPGHPERAVVVATDVTIELEARARRERDEQFREIFVGILGHDLRSPLQHVMASASLLKRRAETAEEARLPDAILRAAHRMNRLTEDMLDLTLSRLGGGLPIKRDQVDLTDILGTTIEELAEGQAERFVVQVDGETNGNWDRTRLGQVLSNLLSNAIKYGTPGKPITLRIDGSSAGRVRVDVHNPGKPIPAELLPVIFDPFRRAADPTHHNEDGIGLGLFIAEQVVQAHGGTIEVRTSSEEGTTFSFSLPRAGK